jgi:hypothetical protein
MMSHESVATEVGSQPGQEDTVLESLKSMLQAEQKSLENGLERSMRATHAEISKLIKKTIRSMKVSDIYEPEDLIDDTVKRVKKVTLSGVPVSELRGKRVLSESSHLLRPDLVLLAMPQRENPREKLERAALNVKELERALHRIQLERAKRQQTHFYKQFFGSSAASEKKEEKVERYNKWYVPKQYWSTIKAKPEKIGESSKALEQAIFNRIHNLNTKMVRNPHADPAEVQQRLEHEEKYKNLQAMLQKMPAAVKMKK